MCRKPHNLKDIFSNRFSLQLSDYKGKFSFLMKNYCEKISQKIGYQFSERKVFAFKCMCVEKGPKNEENFEKTSIEIMKNVKNWIKLRPKSDRNDGADR